MNPRYKESDYVQTTLNKVKAEQKIVNMQNPEEVNKLLSQGYIFLSTVNTTDATFALLEKRN